MPGLWKTIALFLLAALALAYANHEDVTDRYPPIDFLLWVCLATAAALSVRAFVELVRRDSMQGDQGGGGTSQ